MFLSSYPRSGYYTQVLHYSNPNVLYAGTYPTGTALNNNARILTENRFVIAAIGNEQETCPGVVGNTINLL
jgi:hypothetical protein